MGTGQLPTPALSAHPEKAHLRRGSQGAQEVLDTDSGRSCSLILKVGRPSVCPPLLTACGIRSALPTWTALPGKAQAQMSPVLLPKVPAPPAPPLHLVPCLGRVDGSFFSQNRFAVLSSPTLSDSRGCPPWYPAALHVNICQVNQMVTPSLPVDILRGSGAWCLGLSQGGSGSAAGSPSALQGLVYGE